MDINTKGPLFTVRLSDLESGTAVSDYFRFNRLDKLPGGGLVKDGYILGAVVADQDEGRMWFKFDHYTRPFGLRSPGILLKPQADPEWQLFLPQGHEWRRFSSRDQWARVWPDSGELLTRVALAILDHYGFSESWVDEFFDDEDDDLLQMVASDEIVIVTPLDPRAN